MIPLDRLIAIAQDINMVSEAAQLCLIKERSSKENCELILPLVGEFSSGKTTLLNSLTDSKQLETATKPTTATIYEVHFGSEKCYAEIYDADGSKTEIEEISSLKNEGLEDSLVINVFDTASRIPSSIILVDTPGLSSPDPRHKQTLIDFLPKADGVLLVVDINSQITRSLTDFIKTMELAKRPVFLVLTKCDTKAESEIAATKEYIAQNCKLPLSQVVCVSASSNDNDELYKLLDSIQSEKALILEKVNDQRIKGIIDSMMEHIDELLAVSTSDKELENAIRQKEMELKRINRKIDKLLSASQTEIEETERSINRKFEDSAFERLDAIVASKSDNYNSEALSTINSLVSIYLNEFKTNISNIISKKVSEQSFLDDGISLQSFSNIDLEKLSISGMSFNLDLNVIGHEYDSMIATGVKVAAAAAAVAVVVSTAGGAAGAVGAVGTAAEVGSTAGTAAELALDAGTMLEAVDVASDVGNIISNQKHISRVQQAMSFAGQVGEQYNNVNEMSGNIGQQMGQKKGIVESMVGFVTDNTMGKPQRRRAIRIYLDETLLPQFKSSMKENCRTILDGISTSLNKEAQVTIAEKRNALEQLQKQHKDQKDNFQQRLEILRDYKKELITL